MNLLEPASGDNRMVKCQDKVLDLFCGAGGFIEGFRSERIRVTGVDLDHRIAGIAEARGWNFVQQDLSSAGTENFGYYPVVVGGPPCKPWSVLNTTLRSHRHSDYKLVSIFFKYIMDIRPSIFLMENVPGLASSRVFKYLVNRIGEYGYSCESKVVQYSDWGAPTARRRLILAGFLGRPSGPGEFFRRLESRKGSFSTVGDAIIKYVNLARDDLPDHVWPDFRTIERYRDKYKEGKYGWYQLSMDRPAPSFGNVAKTYILHPYAGENGFPLRVISIREALAIMGFPEDFVFPDGMSMSLRYQMIADAVSPVFSQACAGTIREMVRQRRER